MTAMTLNHDPGDLGRRVYIEAVISKMESSPFERTRILSKAGSLLDLKEKNNLAGQLFIKRWRAILSMPLSKIKMTLLQEGADGVEMRHAHLFAGAILQKEANLLRQRS